MLAFVVLPAQMAGGSCSLQGNASHRAPADTVLLLMHGRQWPAAQLHCAGGKGRPQHPSNAAGTLLAAQCNIAALRELPIRV